MALRGIGFKKLLQPLVEWVRNRIVCGALSTDSILRKHISVVPNTVCIHPTNACNARCVFCNYSYNPEKKIIGKTDQFRKVIDQWLEMMPSVKGTEIDLSTNNGDPLIDPDLIGKISYAKARGVERIYFSTNGILLRKKGLADALISSLGPMDSIGISLPGFDREDYERVFGVDKANAVLEGVIALAEAKKAAKSKTEIPLFFRIDRPFEEVLKDEGMQKLSPYIDDGTIIIPPEQIRMDNLFTWGNVITQDKLPGTMVLRTIDFKPTRRPCRNPLKDVSVLPEGQVRVCSCQYMTSNHDELVIGDTRQQDLSEIIMGPVHRKLVREMANGNWPEVCANCSIYQPIHFTMAEYTRLLTDVIIHRCTSTFRRIKGGVPSASDNVSSHPD